MKFVILLGVVVIITLLVMLHTKFLDSYFVEVEHHYCNGGNINIDKYPILKNAMVNTEGRCKHADSKPERVPSQNDAILKLDSL